MAGTSRPLTGAERKMARLVFGDAIDYDAVTVNHRKWYPLQPAKFIMAPDGHIWVHPKSPWWSDDYGAADYKSQELFIHEMTHVWQAQTKGKYYLPLMRHPFCRYEYKFVPGKPFGWYGLEQQAEIVRHVFVWKMGWDPGPGVAPLEALEPLLPFGGSSA
jgi:hypothetical protein